MAGSATRDPLTALHRKDQRFVTIMSYVNPLQASNTNYHISQALPYLIVLLLAQTTVWGTGVLIAFRGMLSAESTQSQHNRGFRERARVNTGRTE